CARWASADFDCW
nr:immunoglobulin heavy chain junction region [Macaca mulatta]